MECVVAREALSARIDGERSPVPADRVDEHLATCSDCCAWFVSASELSRVLSTRGQRTTPDLTENILAAAGVEVPQSRWRRTTGWILRDHRWRAVLVLIGIAQLLLGLAQALGGVTAMPAMGMASAMSDHLFNESTAWNLALGVAFVVAGWRPHTTSGLLPVLTVFTATLTAYVVADSLAGHVTGVRIASHGFVLAGLVVTARVWHRYRREQLPPPAHTAKPAGQADDLTLPPGAKYGRPLGHLRDATNSAA